MDQDDLSDAERGALAALLPLEGGDEVMPSPEAGEVEVARLIVRSLQHDVTCAYARQEADGTRYRIVDTHGGASLQGPAVVVSQLPMSTDEFVDFYLAAFPLIDLLELVFGAAPSAAQAALSASSRLYPDFAANCRERVADAFLLKAARSGQDTLGDRCPYCKQFNGPAVADTCAHLCTGRWDERIKVRPEGREFELAFRQLSLACEAAGLGTPVRRRMAVRAEGNATRQTLLKAGALGGRYMDMLERVYGAKRGVDQWGETQVLARTGYNLYLKDPAALAGYAAECLALLAEGEG